MVHYLVTEIKNLSTIKPRNGRFVTASSTVKLKQPISFSINQSISKIDGNLRYNINVENDTRCNIYNIILKDVLPEGVNFISTQIENGIYRYIDSAIFYHIHIIKACSSCKIDLNVQPITCGEKINFIWIATCNSEFNN